MSIIDFILGFMCGIIVCRIVIIYFERKIERKTKSSVESIFEIVLKNSNKLKLSKYTDNIILLQYGTWTILYAKNTNEVHIFEKEDFIASSVQIKNSHTIDSLIKYINLNWGHMFNKYSGNIHTTSPTNNLIDEYELDIDDILDKINDVGFNNLTQIEKDFLKKQSK